MRTVREGSVNILRVLPDPYPRTFVNEQVDAIKESILMNKGPMIGKAPILAEVSGDEEAFERHLLTDPTLDSPPDPSQSGWTLTLLVCMSQYLSSQSLT